MLYEFKELVYSHFIGSHIQIIVHPSHYLAIIDHKIAICQSRSSGWIGVYDEHGELLHVLRT
ncbi:hypothetical protein QB910_000137 [Dabrowskivirus KKP3916]|uniref:Uncharacterized protein n=1 Tax=Alicyclobacillus phage KKP_3916 TaxID=3040651 RepID=A0AAT9V8G5_9CAUD|nr:hypothetical protein QB910_000137 [Alicyclobacillus phage KKP 3916]